MREIFSFKTKSLKIPFSVSDFKSIISEKGMHGKKVMTSSNGIMIYGTGSPKMIPCISKLYGNSKCSCKTAKKKYKISSNSKNCVICHREALDNFLNRKY